MVRDIFSGTARVQNRIAELNGRLAGIAVFVDAAALWGGVAAERTIQDGHCAGSVGSLVEDAAALVGSGVAADCAVNKLRSRDAEVTEVVDAATDASRVATDGAVDKHQSGATVVGTIVVDAAALVSTRVTTDRAIGKC